MTAKSTFVQLQAAILVSSKIKQQHWRSTKLVEQVHVESFIRCGNDPSAGSPTETLLRLHLPLNGEVKKSSHNSIRNEANGFTVPIFHRVIQSVGATGGVYKGQGRNQCKLMTCVY